MTEQTTSQTTGQWWRFNMPFAVVALAAVNFAIGTQGFAFAGLLSELANDLEISLGTAGLLVTASAVTFAIGAPIAAMLVAGVERKTIIVAGLVVLGAANLLCAVASSFPMLMGLRILAGLSTAFIGSFATVAVASLVSPENRGRAFALVLGGLTVAFVLGVPLGSVFGGLYGWRATFIFSTAVALLSALLILGFVPKIYPMPGQKPSTPL